MKRTEEAIGRIEKRFDALRGEGRRAFMPFVAACDPSPEASVEVILALERAGADMVELGVAYSDPLADGPVIQDSYARVLDRGCTLADALAVVRRVRERSEIPIAAMLSYSIISKRGAVSFCAEAAEAGVDALIVPDLPPEEGVDLVNVAGEAALGVVFLVAPTTAPERRERIISVSRPFIYYVSVVGITGARESLPAELAEGVASVKAATATPVVVGFGVSRPEQAARVAGIADGVIVGSALVKVIADHRDNTAEMLEAVASSARPLADAVHGVRA